MGIQRRKAKLTRHILRRNCLVKYLIEGKIVGIKRRIIIRRRRKELLDDLKEKNGYWKLKEEALDHVLCTACFGAGYGSRMTDCKMVNDRIHPLSYLVAIKAVCLPNTKWNF
jgi:hypothetical protein